MKAVALSLLVVSTAAALAQSSTSMHISAGSAPAERLGTVSFAVSCAPQVQAPFNRGVALLHDFWYAEAQPQFERIAKEDPNCAMAHWGIAMSIFQQIWERPSDKTMKLGWEEMQKAQSLGAKTERERDYIAALVAFYMPGHIFARLDMWQQDIDAQLASIRAEDHTSNASIAGHFAAGTF